MYSSSRLEWDDARRGCFLRGPAWLALLLLRALESTWELRPFSSPFMVLDGFVAHAVKRPAMRVRIQRNVGSCIPEVIDDQ